MEEQDFGMLIRGITANVNQYIGTRLERYGIKQGQYEYFMHIYAKPGINQLELARLKNVGKASVTKALGILEADGLIIREVNESDRRNYRCYLTQAGADIITDIKDIKSESEDKLFKGFSDENKDTFFLFLTKLYDNSAALLNSTKEVDKWI
jgi:DNA-binding MarR family transcriptional regulator